MNVKPLTLARRNLPFDSSAPTFVKCFIHVVNLNIFHLSFYLTLANTKSFAMEEKQDGKRFLLTGVINYTPMVVHGL